MKYKFGKKFCNVGVFSRMVLLVMVWMMFVLVEIVWMMGFFNFVLVVVKEI